MSDERLYYNVKSEQVRLLIPSPSDDGLNCNVKKHKSGNSTKSTKEKDWIFRKYNTDTVLEKIFKNFWKKYWQIMGKEL